MFKPTYLLILEKITSAPLVGSCGIANRTPHFTPDVHPHP